MVEPNDENRAALAQAVLLAQSNHAQLTVVGVTERVSAGIGMAPGGPISADIQEAMVSAHEQSLDALLTPYRAQVALHIKILIGVPFLEIIHEVLRGGHDLVIKTAQHHDWLNRVLATEDMRLLRKCPCPVWLIRRSTPTPCRCILAAVDVDDHYPPGEQKKRQVLNQQILHMGASLALSESAALHVVHVWDAVGEDALRGAFMNIPEEKIRDHLEQLGRRHTQALDVFLREVQGQAAQDGVAHPTPHTHVVKGAARKEIPALARRIEADVVVMGTLARSGIPGLIMGNTAETILNQIDCAVLAIKPPGFLSPVTLQE